MDVVNIIWTLSLYTEYVGPTPLCHVLLGSTGWGTSRQEPKYSIFPWILILVSTNVAGAFPAMGLCGRICCRAGNGLLKACIDQCLFSVEIMCSIGGWSRWILGWGHQECLDIDARLASSAFIVVIWSYSRLAENFAIGRNKSKIRLLNGASLIHILQNREKDDCSLRSVGPWCQMDIEICCIVNKKYYGRMVESLTAHSIQWYWQCWPAIQCFTFKILPSIIAWRIGNVITNLQLY